MDEDLKLKAQSLLRRAGLAHVPKPALACMLVLALLLVIGALWRFWPSGNAVSSEDFEVVAAAEEQDVDAAQEVTVDVEGAVKKPGLYTLQADARVGDAVEAAGGLCKKAAKGAINLAEKIQDGQQISVPKKSDSSVSKASQTEGAESGGSAGSGEASGSTSTSGKININTATAQELQALSGIGESISQRIVDYRETNGAFSSVDDLTNVSGIGDVRLAAIRDQICV